LHRLNFSCIPALAALCLLQACASLPQNFTREATTKLESTNTALAQSYAARAATHSGLSGAYPLAEGVEALAARVALARRAEQSLDVQYYIWHGDESGRLLLKELLDAADRGVRVRLLVDDLGVGAANDDVYRWLDAHPNVSVVLFNPIALRDSRKLGMVGDPRRLNRRMHNKSMTADNTVTVVGGRNIGNEYFSLNELVNFADLDVLAIGPVAGQVADSFDEYWNSAAAIPVSAFHPEPASAHQQVRSRAALEEAVAKDEQHYYEALSKTDLGKKLASASMEFYWADITALYDSPTKADEQESTVLLEQLGNLLGRAQSDLLIVSPYFVPGKAGTAALVAAEQRGVRVRVVTNSLASTDVGAVHAGYKKSRRKLLEGGVELFEMMPSPDIDPGDANKRSIMGSSGASLHAKLFVLDGENVFIGSMNLDPRSVNLNTEIGLLVASAEMADDVTREMDELLGPTCYRVELQPDGSKQQLVWIEDRDGELVRYDQEPKTTFWDRFSVGLIGLLPIDSQL
jgi:putative cardiolipin synthase